MHLQNKDSTQSVMQKVDEAFCRNGKQIDMQTGTELKATFDSAKAQFGIKKTLPTPVGERKTTLLEFRAEVKLQVLFVQASCIQYCYSMPD